MSNNLDTIRQASASVEAARVALRDSIYLAHLCGERAVDIARAAGVTRQRVYQLVAEVEAELEQARARVAEIDKRYAKLVDTLSESETLGNLGERGWQAVTGVQNGVNGKRRRNGKDDAYRPLKAVRRDVAESKLLRLLDDRRDEPVIRDVVAQLDEAAGLRKRLEAFDDARAFGEVI